MASISIEKRQRIKEQSKKVADYLLSMTDNNHPITPPPELVVEWADTIYQQTECDDQRDLYVATQAARWGADMELDACCEWIYKLMDRGLEWSMDLRAARRPKPPSLKEQSLALIDKIQGSKEAWDISDLNVVRRALESLPE